MGRKSRLILAAAGVVAAGFLLGLVEIFVLGHDRGDVYPPYSSYRSDPLGVRALYDSLGSLPAISALRNLKPVSSLKEGRGKTLFICGARPGPDPEEDIEALEGFVARGGRLVIAFFPTKRKSARRGKRKVERDAKSSSKNDKKADGPKKEDEKDERPWAVKCVDIEERWGFSVEFLGLTQSKDGASRETLAKKGVEGEGLPGSLSWHSTLAFKGSDEAWRTVYSRDGLAVVMERPWGKGSIVLLGDSFVLSNEAMRHRRHPGLLAWLVGPSPTVVFDETHLGIRERPGIMALVREYRLGRVLGVLALLAGLFVWRNVFSLVPKKREASPGDVMLAEGRDSAAGLVSLMERSIPKKEILSVCWKEWQGSQDISPRLTRDQSRRIVELIEAQRALSPRRRGPVAAYKKIHEILAKRSL